MNWFHTAFADAVFNPGRWLHEVNTGLAESLFFLTVALAILLLVKRRMSTRAVLIVGAAVLAVAETVEIGTLRPLWFLPGPRVSNLSGLSVALILGVVAGLAHLLGSLLRRYRSLPRLAVGLSVFMMSSLAICYHMLLVNGLMKTVMNVQEDYLLAALAHDDDMILATCEVNGWYCTIRPKGEGLPEHKRDGVQREFSDHYAFYKVQHGSSPFAYSASNGLILDDAGYIYAFQETEDRYYLIAEERHQDSAFDMARIAYTVVFNGIVGFWAVFAVLVVVLHGVMLRRRRRRRALHAS